MLPAFITPIPVPVPIPTAASATGQLHVPAAACAAKPPPPPNPYLTVELARDLQQHALRTCRGDAHVLADVCARGFAQAFRQCYPPAEYLRVFVAVGSGFNGLVGIYVALHLSRMGYQPGVYMCELGNKHLHGGLRRRLADASISIFDFIPSTVTFLFDALVDALLGVGADGADIRQHLWTVYELFVCANEVPIASVDLPSGWDLSLGPRHVDYTADTFIKPDLLVSLLAPKLASKKYKGHFHFIAALDHVVGRDWFEDRGVLGLPQRKQLETAARVATDAQHDHDESFCVLFESNAKPFGKRNGESYNQPGQFNATLFTKNASRTWYDPEDENSADDIWDELD